MGVLKIGSKAPDFSGAVLDDGSRFSLSEALAHGPLVMFFFSNVFSGN